MRPAGYPEPGLKGRSLSRQRKNTLRLPERRHMLGIGIVIGVVTTILSNYAVAFKPAGKTEEWIYRNKKGGWDHMELCFWAKTKWNCNMVRQGTCPPTNARAPYCSETDYLDCTEWILRSGFRFCSCHCGIEPPLMVPTIRQGPGNHSNQGATPAPSKTNISKPARNKHH
ncbi:uncharacterized protein LOC119373351 isoform X2 [Rhipicephalus sanguineus]|uniref:uncharacterized protein LOC119373351 isoform X2 n=1 Tax=Rhipicephalus sanguineus TaxID=34632 RepID=UPI001896135C|nr:uncharacterized protein LOC119373351 isoform X2 [Rhipicephalus sanguineus]